MAWKFNGFNEMKTGIAFAALLTAPPAWAEDPGGAMYLCSFETECYESDACQVADFTVDVATPATLPGPASLLMETGPSDGEMTQFKQGWSVQSSDEHGRYLLSAVGDVARLSVHYSGGPLVITYHGSCREAD